LRAYAREAADVNRQLQDAAVGGLREFEDSLISIIDGTKSASEAFSDMAKSIISDLARIAIRQTITGPIASLLGFADGGLVSLRKFADGGMTGRSQFTIIGVLK